MKTAASVRTSVYAGSVVRSFRVVALAAALAVATLGLPAIQASAQDNNPDPGVRCAAKIGPGEYEFYLPGERATDVNGNKWVCGPDGQWFRDYSALTGATQPVTGINGGIKPTSTNNVIRGSANLGTFQMAR